MRKSALFSFLSLLVVAVIVLGGCAPQQPAASPEAPKAAEPTQAPAAAEPTKAPAAKPAEKPSIRFAYLWTGGDAKAAPYEGALKKYIDENKDKVNIVLEATPGDEHRNKVKVDLAGNNVADVMLYWTGEPTLRPFIDAGVLADMDTVLAKSTKTKRDQWSKASLANSIVDGKLWTLPVEAFHCFTLANKTLFDKKGLKIPKTYAELKDVAKAFNADNIVPLDQGSKGGNPGHLFFNTIVYQYKDGNNDVANVAKSFNVSTDSFKKAAGAVEQMVKDKIFPADTIANGDWGPSIVLYNEGKAAMLYSCPWMIGAIKPEIAAVSEVVDFVKVDGAEVDPASFNLGGTVMGVVVKKDAFQDPAKQAAIVDLVDYLVSDYVFTELGKAPMMPAKNVKLDPAKLNPLFVKIVDFTSKQDNNAVLWSVLPSATSQEVFLETMDELFAGTSADAVLKKFQAAVDKDKK
jgi:ABC-type glycerol-3-phosphate transport system substrate-binding protein